MSSTESENNIDERDLYIFNKIKNLVRDRINNIGIYYYESPPQEAEIADFIQKSVEFRESNSVIVCGPPGCGKTNLIKHVLEKLSEENVINNWNAMVVNLSGLLHTDDRLALRDIIKQLNLSEGSRCGKSDSFQENLIHLFEEFKEKKQNDGHLPCTIFILDDFHLFCEHKNQILLYNLFDFAQSSKAPICIIGLTYYTDVADLLEKRVLSRFSHRIIWLQNNAKVENRLMMFKNIFSFNDNDLHNIDKIYKLLWNGRVQVLVESNEVIESLKRQLDTIPSLNNFNNFMIKLLNSVTFEKPLLTVKRVNNACVIPDYYILALGNLSILEIALVIAIKHQSVNDEKESFNFEMIYSQYLKFSEKYSTTLITERSVVLKGFQRLEELEVIIPVKKTFANNAGTIPLEFRLYNFNLTPQQVSEGFKLNRELPTELKQWLHNLI